MLWIQEAASSGARLKPACEEAYISLRTYRRWIVVTGTVCADQRPLAIHPTPTNRLSDVEVSEILTVCNQSEYSSLPPSQIVPGLADKGIYLASESTFYRVLRANNQLTHRGRSKEPRHTKIVAGNQGLPLAYHFVFTLALNLFLFPLIKYRFLGCIYPLIFE